MEMKIRTEGEADPRGGFVPVLYIGSAKILLGGNNFDSASSAEEAATNYFGSAMRRVIAAR